MSIRCEVATRGSFRSLRNSLSMLILHSSNTRSFTLAVWQADVSWGRIGALFLYKRATKFLTEWSFVSQRTTRKPTLLLKMRSSNNYTTFTSHLWGADSPGHGTGTWISEEPQMTLTYRGKKYVQLQGAGFDATKKAQLTYRGLSYTKWAQGFTSKPRLKRGFFIPVTKRASGAGKPLKRWSTCHQE